MLFNSYIFIFIFLPAALMLYYGLNSLKQYTMAKIALVILSVVFYSYCHLGYAVLLLGSIAVNFIIHSFLIKEKRAGLRKTCLVCGIVFNLGLLGYFKYLGFFTENMNQLFGADFTVIKVALPLGISFFTFQQVSFVIDSYYRKTEHYALVDYALFVSFFPQLVAGPIVLHSEIVPQFADETKKKLDYSSLAAGIRYFAMGMAKKVLVADYFGRIVDAGYGNIWALDCFGAISVMLAYTFQIYFDFSGYCDMAAGLAKMFRITLPLNFNSPYKAVNISEFWKRWHMTLTRFFTTYLYIPLGGNRKGKARTYINIMIIFAASGLWHGADWSFVLWGLLHGAALVFWRMSKDKITIPKGVSYCLTFAFINVTWVLFRAESIGQAKALFGRMLHGGMAGFLLAEYVMYGAALLVVLLTKNTHERVNDQKLSLSVALADIVLLVASIFSLSQVSAFLYFNF